MKTLIILENYFDITANRATCEAFPFLVQQGYKQLFVGYSSDVILERERNWLNAQLPDLQALHRHVSSRLPDDLKEDNDAIVASLPELGIPPSKKNDIRYALEKRQAILSMQTTIDQAQQAGLGLTFLGRAQEFINPLISSFRQHDGSIVIKLCANYFHPLYTALLENNLLANCVFILSYSREPNGKQKQIQSLQLHEHHSSQMPSIQFYQSVIASAPYTVETISNRTTNLLGKTLILLTLMRKYKLDLVSGKNLAIALRRAAAEGHPEDLILLIQGGANVNEQDSNPLNKKTAMHWAIIKSHLPCIEVLRSYGANFMTIQDAKGKTPAQYIPDGLNQIRSLLLGEPVQVDGGMNYRM